MHKIGGARLIAVALSPGKRRACYKARRKSIIAELTSAARSYRVQ